MGFQDRDYYREGSQAAYVTSMVTKLIIINGLVFLAEILFGQSTRGDENWVVALLAVRGDTLLKPLFWWQFLTAGFVHSERLINHILFNMLGLYVFGRRLEDRYGPFELLRFYLVAIVLGMIVWNVRVYLASESVPQPVRMQELERTTCLGASGGVTAVTLLFCLLYPRATVLANFLFPVPAWVIGVLIVVNNLFGVEEAIAYDVHLVGAALAAVYWFFGWNFGRLPGLDELKRSLAAPRRWLAARPPLKVHDPEQYYEDLDAEADRLLEKVNREGLSSLNADERRLLEDYSRRTRQKLR